MTRQTDRIALPGQTAGTSRTVTLHRYGQRGARPKAYIQASLHADETPGLLVAHHLARLLDEADARGEITGEIVLVPYANPIGLANFVNSTHLGRYELMGGGNFNRNWPDFFEPVAAKIEGQLTDDSDSNAALIRAAMKEVIEAQATRRELPALRQILAREACDADIVLDLHCDDEALMHLFLIPALWPGAAELAAELGCRAVMLSDPAGGDPFDEAFSSPWTRWAARFPSHPIPLACLSGTVELRGRADVSDQLAAPDAAALARFLQRRGLVAGDPGPLPAALCEAVPLDAVDTIKAPDAGVLAYQVELGDTVKTGQTVAELVDPAAENPAAARQPIVSRTDGLVLSLRAFRFVAPGMTVAKIVGKESLAHRTGTHLLED